MLSARGLRRALAEADFLRLLDVQAIEGELRSRRPGSKALRSALSSYLPSLARTRSELEERFLELCGSARLPVPETNVRVESLVVDAVWPEQHLVVELDGAAAHGSWSRIKRDRERELVLRAEGYRVVRYTWEQVTTRRGEVVADLQRLLASDPG